MRTALLALALLLAVVGCHGRGARTPSAAPVDVEEAASCPGKSIEAQGERGGAPVLHVRISCVEGRPMLEDLAAATPAPRELSKEAWTHLWTEVDAAGWRTVPEKACAGSETDGERWTVQIVEPDTSRQLACTGVASVPEGNFKRIVDAIEATAAAR